MPKNYPYECHFQAIKIIKYKEKILKEARGKKHFTYRGTKISITSNFSKTIQAKTEWSEIFKMLRKKLQLCTLQIIFKSKGEINSQTNKN